MESIKRVEECSLDCSKFEEGINGTDAFEFLTPNDYLENQRAIVEEFNRRAEIGNQRHRTALHKISEEQEAQLE